MFGFKVGLELFAAVEDAVTAVFIFAVSVNFALGIWDARGGLVVAVVTVSGGHARFGTFPCLATHMLRVLVAFPIVFTAEAAGAGGVGTAVRAGVSFHVFPAWSNLSAKVPEGKISAIWMYTSDHIEFSFS